MIYNYNFFMINNILQQSLVSIGLDDTTIKVYIALLNSPDLNVTDISRELGFGRNKIYETIDILSSFGLIEHSKDYSRKINLRSPSIIATLLKNKKYQVNHTLTNFEEVLPSLVTNYFEAKKEPEIKFYEGINKFVYLMNQVLSESELGSELLSFNEGQNLWKIVDQEYFVTVWIEKRVAKNIFAKIVLQYNPTQLLKMEIKKDDEKLRQMKMLNKSTDSHGCYWIIGTKVIHWDTQKANAVMIDNFTIAENMKANFNMIWESLG